MQPRRGHPEAGHSARRWCGRERSELSPLSTREDLILHSLVGLVISPPFSLFDGWGEGPLGFELNGALMEQRCKPIALQLYLVPSFSSASHSFSRLFEHFEHHWLRIVGPLCNQKSVAMSHVENQLKLNGSLGVYVAAVDPDGQAHQLGVQPGAVLRLSRLPLQVL